ncbi:MAG: hypothetical protein ACP5F8_03750 [Candidatus Aenigmatarchaeota archaeon]
MVPVGNPVPAGWRVVVPVVVGYFFLTGLVASGWLVDIEAV